LMSVLTNTIKASRVMDLKNDRVMLIGY